VTHQHHISRKELKTDEVRETLIHGAEAALSHQKIVLWGLVSLIVLAAGVLGWRIYSQRQDVKSWAAFEEAGKIFQARIRQANETPDPSEVTYLQETSKYEDAVKKYAAVAEQYPRTRAGRVARYYVGLCYERLNKLDDAQKWLQQAEDAGDPELAALARFRMAAIHERTAKFDDAVKIYQQLMATPATMVPKPLVMLTLADLYRKTKNPEAEKLYQQIGAEFPGTEVARVAQERLESVAPKS
jgi:tetratricopeptide (TPR) repeat protein